MLFVRALYIQYPVILADEALYALHATFLNNPRFAVQLPNVLFFLIYHSASWFGGNHFAITKLLNAIVFALSLVPLYAIAREFLSNTGAYLFAVAVVLSPISSYTAYVMPEAMFFFAFWVLAYVVLVKLPANIIYGGVYLGFAKMSPPRSAGQKRFATYLHSRNIEDPLASGHRMFRML